MKKSLFLLLGAVILVGIIAGCKPKEEQVTDTDTTAVTLAAAPVCQSCAMPMAKPEDFGTEANGTLSKDYCIYCYKDGKFTAPDMTIDQMVEFLAPKWGEWTGKPDMTIEDAKKEVNQTLAGLKRWKTS